MLLASGRITETVRASVTALTMTIMDNEARVLDTALAEHTRTLERLVPTHVACELVQDVNTNAVTETTPFTLDVQVIEGEPRVLDTDLAKALGMARPTNIRRTIEACRPSREQFGSLHAACAVIQAGKGALREGVAYHLNEEQALYVTMHCKTDRAATK